MSEPAQAALEEREIRILILAPFGRDAQLAEQALVAAGLASRICAGLPEVHREIGLGAGAVLVTDEALAPEGAAIPDAWIGPEPPWSDLPLVVMTDTRHPRRVAAVRRLEQRRNVTFLGRPVPRLTLVSTLRAALESRRRQYAVRDLLKQLERGVRQRDEFLATLGHELRNPLGAIRTAIDLLQAELAESGVMVRRATGVLDRQTQHLKRILDDLLEVSRITRGKVELRRAPLELRELCRNTVEATRGEMEKRRHRLSLVLPDEAVWVEADATRIEQILWNLLSNAAKYTDSGGHVQLALAVEGGSVRVSVRDDGRGMSPDFLERAFDLFAQAEMGRGGLGLGLTLSRRLADLHHGSLTAQSEGLGQGSEFVLRLPRIDSPAAVAGTAEPPRDTSRRRVLIVEDHADLAWGLATLLRDLGHEARVARTGGEALEMVAEYRPGLVLVDAGLPDLHGTVVARRIREALGGEPVLAMMTGFGEESLRRQSREAGCDRHLTKPIAVADLHQLLASAALRSAGAPG